MAGALPPEIPTSGISDNIHLSISEIQLLGSSTIEPQQAGVTAIVGANNSGKTTLLTELTRYLNSSSDRTAGAPKPKVLQHPVIDKRGSSSDCLAWLYKHAAWGRSSNRRDEEGFNSATGGFLSPRDASTEWDRNMGARLGALYTFMVNHTDAGSRTYAINGTAAPEATDLSHAHPVHRMRDDSEFATTVNTYFRELFGSTLMVDWLSNHAMWRLRIGKPSLRPPTVDKPAKPYIDELATLESLEEQGDGMRNLMGIVVSLISGNYPITIIDEPEAYLHPPQARALGQILGQVAHRDKQQVIVATHDRNLLVGLLESGAPISVVRLDRAQTLTQTHQLDAQKLETVWSDSVLKYSNALDALFHRAVVLCEGDGDCRFYSAALDANKSLKRTAKRAPGRIRSTDVLFVPCGGIDGFPKLTNALRATRTPTFAIADIDVLRDRQKLKVLIMAFGGSWQDVKDAYDTFIATLQRPGSSPLTNREILTKVASILEANPSDAYSKSLSERLRTTTKWPDTWSDLKKRGIYSLSGQARKSADSLIAYLESIGIIIVTRGELESLAPAVTARKGPGWIREAFESEAYAGRHPQQLIGRLIRAVRAATISTEGDVPPSPANP